MTFDVIYTNSTTWGDQYSEPQFSITNVSAPSTVAPGDTVSVTVTVQNVGTADGDVTVKILDSNNNVVASQSATISAGSSSDVTLSFTAPSSEGQYTYTVVAYNNTTNTDDDSTTFTITVQQQQNNPLFSITNVNAPSTVTPGSTVNVVVTVQNSGSADGQVTVKILDSNNNEVASKSATISAGSQSDITLSFTAPSTEGQYTYTVVAHNDVTNADDDSKTFTITVQQQQTNPHFTIISINYPSSVETGATVNVSVVIANDGGSDGIATVHIYKGTELVASKSVNVVAGSTATAQLSFTAPATPGSYDYEVRVINNTTGNLDALQTITIQVTQPTQPPTEETTQKSWLEQYWWILLIIAVIILLLFLGERKK